MRAAASLSPVPIDTAEQDLTLATAEPVFRPSSSGGGSLEGVCCAKGPRFARRHARFYGNGCRVSFIRHIAVPLTDISSAFCVRARARVPQIRERTLTYQRLLVRPLKWTSGHDSLFSAPPTSATFQLSFTLAREGFLFREIMASALHPCALTSFLWRVWGFSSIRFFCRTPLDPHVFVQSNVCSEPTAVNPFWFVCKSTST
jgi:hypothetical protein